MVFWTVSCCVHFRVKIIFSRKCTQHESVQYNMLIDVFHSQRNSEIMALGHFEFILQLPSPNGHGYVPSYHLTILSGEMDPAFISPYMTYHNVINCPSMK